jgi:hypothetical protein
MKSSTAVALSVAPALAIVLVALFLARYDYQHGGSAVYRIDRLSGAVCRLPCLPEPQYVAEANLTPTPVIIAAKCPPPSLPPLPRGAITLPPLPRGAIPVQNYPPPGWKDSPSDEVSTSPPPGWKDTPTPHVPSGFTLATPRSGVPAGFTLATPQGH